MKILKPFLLLLSLASCSSLSIPPDPDVGVYFVDASINNKPVVFLIDSGASYLNIPLYLAKSLNISIPALSSQSASTADGARIPEYFVTVKELKLGNCNLYNITATMTDTDMPFILFGESAIKQISLNINNNKMTIFCK
jgi:aspartyl protease family protein